MNGECTMLLNLSPKKQQEATSPEAIVVLMTFALWVLCCVWTSDGLDSVTDMMLPWLILLAGDLHCMQNRNSCCRSCPNALTFAEHM